jgi:hypothetical protein
MTMNMTLAKVDDFEVTGDGKAAQWKKAEWQPLKLVGKAKTGYATKAKVVSSEKGIYFLFDSEDKKLTCSMFQDCQDIYREDVIEVFLWPNEEQDLYFEYEISPMAVELPILVPNYKGGFMGWRPWHYEGDRMTRRATSVRGGPRSPMAAVRGWMAEFFIPFALLRGLGNTPPKPGASWRANLYRIDYDSGEATQWAWCEDTGTNFHDFRKFGTMVFG